MTDAIATGLAVTLLLLCGLYWKLAGMPSRLWGIARNELARARHEDDVEAHKALQETADAKVGALIAGLRQYQQQIAADYRKQIADAELRARVAERNAVDTSTALETATALVREVRATLDGLGELPAFLREAREAREAGPLAEVGANRGPAPANDAAAGETDESRKTIEIKPPPAKCASPAAASGVDDDQGWDDPEERTKVFAAGNEAPARRPLSLAAALRGRG